jgi:hypothetical protein
VLKNATPLLLLGGLGVVGLVLASRRSSAGELEGGQGQLEGGQGQLDGFPLPSSDPVKNGLCLAAKVLFDAGQTLTAPSVAGTYLTTMYPEVAWSSVITTGTEGQRAFYAGVLEQATAILADEGFCESFFPEATLGEQAAATLTNMTRPTPTAGSFYQVRAGDSLHGIITAAMTQAGAPLTSSNFYTYGQCLASGPSWNAPLYLRPSNPITNPNDPLVFTQIDAGGTVQNLELAVQAANADVLEWVEAARLPPANFGEPPQPEEGFSNFGRLWLPPIDTTDNGQVLTCGLGVWSDGTSAIDPPPELLDMLQGGILPPQIPLNLLP